MLVLPSRSHIEIHISTRIHILNSNKAYYNANRNVQHTHPYTHTHSRTLSACVHNRYRIHTCKYPLRRERKSFRKTMFIVKAIPRNFALLFSFFSSSLCCFRCCCCSFCYCYSVIIVVVVILPTVIEFTYYNWLVGHNIVCVVRRGFFFAFLFFNLKTTTIFHNTFLLFGNCRNIFANIFPRSFCIFSFSKSNAQRKTHDSDGDKLPNVRYYIPLCSRIYISTYTLIYTYISVWYIILLCLEATRCHSELKSGNVKAKNCNGKTR